MRKPRVSLILVPIGIVIFLAGLYSHEFVTSGIGAVMALGFDVLGRMSSGQTTHYIFL